MKPALQIRVNQQLSLTPQLQQAIRLLQLSSLELELELNTAVESNPLLEVSDGIDDDEDESDDAERGERDDDGSKSDSDSSLDASERQREDDYTSSSSESSDEDFRNERNERDDMPLDLAFERTDYAGSGSGGNHSGDEDAGDREDAATEDLRDHLFWQLNLTPMSPLDRAIAATIIDGVDDDGYLTESNESIASSVATLAHVTEAEIEAVRSRVQQFDPTGVASRDLRECLIAQLSAFADDTGGLELARRLVNECLEQLARNDRPKLCQKLRAEADEMDAAIDLIRSLNPKPGSGFSNAQAEFIAPDAYARKVGQNWQIALSPNAQPKLSINSHYASLIARVQRDDANYLRGQLQEARWLIKSLQARADTILKVATAIVAADRSWRARSRRSSSCFAASSPSSAVTSRTRRTPCVSPMAPITDSPLPCGRATSVARTVSRRGWSSASCGSTAGCCAICAPRLAGSRIQVPGERAASRRCVSSLSQRMSASPSIPAEKPRSAAVASQR